MDADVVVVALIGVKQMAQVPFAEDHNMVKTIPPNRSDDPLRISVLPWRMSRDRTIADAPGTHTADEDWPVGTIAVANEIPWHLSPAVGLGQLKTVNSHALTRRRGQSGRSRGMRVAPARDTHAASYRPEQYNEIVP